MGRQSVLWVAPIFNFSGYADEARNIVSSLQHQGYPVASRMLGENTTTFMEQLAASAPDQLRALHRSTQLPVGCPFVAVHHGPGYSAVRMPEATTNIARTMFETDGLPADWVVKLNDMDEVWVPSSFNEETFRNAGVSTPIVVAPGGVNATLFRPGLRPLLLRGARGTVFLSVFEWSYRKGWDALLAAWADAFRADDDVSLVLRTSLFGTAGGDSFGDSLDQRITDHLATLGRERRDTAPIIVLDRHLSLADIPRLYAAADVYVSASRGEGWGRPMMEAMACRLPTVATRWSGNLDFMDDDNSMLIDIDGLVPIDARMEVTFYQGQRWAEPSAAHLADILRQLAGDPALRRRLGATARRDIEQRWQWKRVVGSMATRLDALDGGRTLGAGRAQGSAVPHAGAEPGTKRAASPVIRWEGDFFAHHSLAGVNRALAGRLASTNVLTVVPVTHETAPFPADTATSMQPIFSASVAAEPGAVDTVVRHRWPPDFGPADGPPLVVIQPWEFGGIPASWVEPIRSHVTELWCPTTWVADCYVRSGIPESMVHVVPNGVDATRYRPDGPCHPIRSTKGCKLLFVGGTISRKGVDVLLRSYLGTFTRQDDVCLVIKAFGAAGVYRGTTLDDQIRSIANDPSTAEVELLEDDLTDEGMAALYRSCDVLVHPYRGEGFGLPVAEAMATALPVVVTGYGACLDFCDETNAHLVPATIRPTTIDGIGPSAGGYWWAEPDGDALGRILREVVNNPDAQRAMGAAGRDRIVSRFTWDAVAETARHRLLALVHASAG